MPRDVDYLKHLLELEYGYSQQAIDKFDEYRSRLKSWMITGVAGVAAVAFSARNSSIFWAGAALVVFFALAELHYISIQEDVVARGRELDRLIDSLSRGQVGPEHDAYRFGLAKAFYGDRMLRLKNVLHWLKYRTFSPFLYGGALTLMIAAALIGPVSRK